MLKIEEIQTFVSIVEAGTMTGAATRLNVAQSAVSRRLTELEKQLGVELFHRTTRKLTLTDSGQGFYTRCVQILADITEAEHSVSQAHQELSGLLRIAAPLGFGVMHLGPAIIEFQKLHPKLKFDIEFNDRQVDILQEGFDLSIRIADLQDSSLIARKLASLSTVICASPAYIQQHGAPQNLEELTQHPCITYGYIPNPDHWPFINNQGEIQIVKVNSILQANNGAFMSSAAIAGIGLVRVPTFVACKAIKAGELVTVLNNYAIPEVNAYALYPPTRHLSQRVRTFIDFLVESYKDTPYWETCLCESAS